MGPRGGCVGGGYGRGDDRPGGARDDMGTRDRRPDDRGMRDHLPEDRGVPARRPGNVGMRDNRSDDMGMRQRRPDYHTHCSPRRSLSINRRPNLSARGPRRSPSPERRLRRSPSEEQRLRRSISLDHRVRRPRDDDSDRDVPPRGQVDYGRVPYRQQRDRYDHHDRVPNGSYDHHCSSGRSSGRFNGPPDYMLPEHPSNLGRATEKETLFGPAGQSMDKDSQFHGNAGVSVRVSSTAMGRTSSLYHDRRSPPMLSPPPAISPPPKPLYPLVPLTETGFLIGGASVNFAVGSTRLRLRHGDSKFQDRDTDHLCGSYGSRENERPDFGRDVLIENHSRSMFDSGIAPSTQLKGYIGSSSSVLTNDHPYRMHGEGYGPINGYIMDGPGRSPHDSLGHGRGCANRLSDSSLEHGSGHDDKLLLDITRQTHSKHPPRTASIEYDAGGYDRRGPDNESYLGNFRGNDSHDLRTSTRHTLGSSPLTRLEDERGNHQMRSSRTRRMAVHKDSMEYNVQHSYDGDTPTRYREKNDAHVCYSRSPENHPLRFARYPQDGRELSDQIVSPMAYRRAPRGTSYSDCDMGIYQGDGHTGREYYNDDIEAYDLSRERIARSSDDKDGYNARYVRPTSCNVFSRIALPNTTNEEQTDADQGNHSCLNTLAHGCSEHKPISERLSRPMVQPQFGGSTMLGRGKEGWTKSTKKRSRAGLPQIYDGHTSYRNEFISPNKISKMSVDNLETSESNHEDGPDKEEISIPKDPPEGSEEFSKQVHQAFFKFSKIINQSPAMQKRYREAKGSLCCCVCGSVSRKFPDIEALISHAYDICKAGFKTKHLGFHKALCVLMGRNWHVPPDTSKADQSVPSEEVNAIKKDLMLWPPVVVIHNSSIASQTKSTEAKIVSKEEIEGVLADIGVTLGKVKISHGTPANQSVFIVKFQPTISGFQEAIRIDGHFSARNHGKEEFLQIKGKDDKLEETLYAHIAVAEDLGYLDDQTKKRCLIMSRKEIEARADATFNLDT